MNLKEIEARIAEIKNELETRAAELTVEESNKLVDEAEQLNEQRKALVEAAEKRNAALANIAAGEGKTVRTFAAPNGAAAEDDDKYGSMAYRKAFMQYVCRGNAIPAEYRTDVSTKTSDVGAVIPTTVVDQIISKLENVGGIMALVTKTAYKGGVAIPKNTVKPVATWVAEGAGSTKQKLAAGSITFAYHKLRCAVSVSLEVDTMSIAAFEAYLVRVVVEAMTKKLEESIIKGSGSGEPTGIINTTAATGDTIATVGLAEPTYKALCDAEGELPEEYEGNAKWCMSKKTFMGFIGMTDEQGQPIARVNHGLDGKVERYLLGREVVCTQHLPSFAAAATDAIVGFLFDFTNYDLNTNYAMGVKKYEDNDTDDQITKAIMLADGKVVDYYGLVLLKKVASV